MIAQIEPFSRASVDNKEETVENVESAAEEEREQQVPVQSEHVLDSKHPRTKSPTFSRQNHSNEQSFLLIKVKLRSSRFMEKKHTDRST